MSYVEIFKVRADGEVRTVCDVRNGMAGALFIWETLREKYHVGEVMKYDALWKMFTDDRMELVDRIVMGMTFDKVIIKRENMPAAIEALQRFRIDHDTPTLFGITGALVGLLDDLDCLGVCFNHTSVSETYWRKYDEGSEESRPYDITTDEGHWYLFDALPAEAATLHTAVGGAH